MRDLGADQQAHKRGGWFRLVQLHGQWHVVGRGYLCMVDGYAEGIKLIERLRSEGQRHRAFVRQRQRDLHAQ